MTDLNIAVTGAAGRMGQMLIKAIASAPGVALSGALERKGHAATGLDAGTVVGLPALGVAVSDTPASAFHGADAIMDFTAPAATLVFAAHAAQYGLIHVIGTTGLAETDFAALRIAAKKARIVQSGNMSAGVNMLAALVKRAAAGLGAGWDIEIVEMHHRMKVDAPSGTALLLGEAAAAGRKVSLREKSARGRDGHTGARKAGDIGFAALRGGSVIGEHSVIIAGNGERLVLQHIAEDRELFASGAVRAALWARDLKPGYYTMADVLGIGG